MGDNVKLLKRHNAQSPGMDTPHIHMKILNLAAVTRQTGHEQIKITGLETLTIIFGGIKSSPSHAMASSSFSASQFKSKSPSKVPQES